VIYGLNLLKGDNALNWYFDTERNGLYDSTGSPINPVLPSYYFREPLIEDTQQIRIVLGRNCNYKCGYCTQNPIKQEKKRNVSDIKRYVAQLKHYYDMHFSPHRSKTHICFWGGEPLVYIDLMKTIIEEVREQFSGDLVFSMVTNGSGLVGDTARYVLDNIEYVGVSYDGPGQWVRNKKDIFDKGTPTRETIEELIRRDGTILLSAVFNKYNISLRNWVEYTRDKLETDKFSLGEIYYNRVHDDLGLSYACNEEQLALETPDRMILAIEETYPQLSFIWKKRVAKIINRLYSTEARADCQTFEQKHYFAVDMEGHLWGCHNTSNGFTDEYGNGTYKGNIWTGEHNILSFAALKKRMPKCKDCLLRWVCNGGCPYTQSKYDPINCTNYWHFYLPFFVKALHVASGGGILTAVDPV
jgi:radical SAM protein with 4Fe4S-binding SPASM domain